MQSLHYVGWWDPDRGDEETSFLLDRHGDEVVELPVRVIVVCLSGTLADLGEREVDAEGEIWGAEVGF